MGVDEKNESQEEIVPDQNQEHADRVEQQKQQPTPEPSKITVLREPRLKSRHW